MPSTAAMASIASIAVLVSAITKQSVDSRSTAGVIPGTPSTARVVPQLRLPAGACRQAATAAAASAALSTSGTITPVAPASSAAPITAGSVAATRTSAGVPATAIGRTGAAPRGVGGRGAGERRRRRGRDRLEGRDQRRAHGAVLGVDADPVVARAGDELGADGIGERDPAAQRGSRAGERGAERSGGVDDR